MRGRPALMSAALVILTIWVAPDVARPAPAVQQPPQTPAVQPQGTSVSPGMMQSCMSMMAARHQLMMTSIDQLAITLRTAQTSNDAAVMRTGIEQAQKQVAAMKAQMSGGAGPATGQAAGAMDMGSCMQMMQKMGGMQGMGGMRGMQMGSAGQAAGAQSTQAAAVIDPVCGMKVDPAKAKTATYKGKTYYFCSDACKEKFEKTPEQYIKK